MSIFAFVSVPASDFKKKVTFRQLFSRPGACDPYVYATFALVTIILPLDLLGN